MATNTRKKLLLPLAFLFSVVLIIPAAESCAQTEWVMPGENPKCPGKMVEIYKMVDGPSGQSSSICCKPGTAGYIQQRDSATSCQATSCLSSTSRDMCSTMMERWVNGTKLQYEETLRATCERQNQGGPGVVALCCDKGSTEQAIVALMGAEINEFPHQAKLKLPGNCGGTIYNKRYIVTAAHCVVDGDTGEVNSAKRMTAVLGSNLADMEGPQYNYQVEEVIVHKEYSGLKGHPNMDKDPRFREIFYDIALLKVDRDIEFGPTIKSLEIAPEGFDPFKYDKRATAVGWGTTDTGALSVHLQKTDFVLRKDAVCQATWGDSIRGHEDIQLCVGGVREGVWSPTAGGGDSGGPAICRMETGKPVLCGITSFGGNDEDCAANSNAENCPPSVYAEVAAFNTWIKEHAGEQDPSTFHKKRLHGLPVGTQMNHQVRIMGNGGKPCGGTLIAPNWVVTAAHCVKFAKLKDLQIVTNVKEWNSVIKAENRVKATGVYVMDGFKKVYEANIAAQGNRIRIADNYYKNDLALVKLGRSVKIDAKDLPKLPEMNDRFYQGIELAFPRKDSGLGNKLMRRNFNLLDITDCQSRMDKLEKVKLNVKVDRNLICGVEEYSGGSTCTRDLGGGLICPNSKKEAVLCGVQVFRMCEWSIPNGFMDVAKYSKWIQAVMKAKS